jgi:hypothetical protein
LTCTSLFDTLPVASRLKIWKKSFFLAIIGTKCPILKLHQSQISDANSNPVPVPTSPPDVVVNGDASESVVTQSITLSIPPPDVVVSVDGTEGTGSPNQPKETRIFKRVKRRNIRPPI